MKHESEMRSNGITKRHGSTERHKKEITAFLSGCRIAVIHK